MPEIAAGFPGVKNDVKVGSADVGAKDDMRSLVKAVIGKRDSRMHTNKAPG